MRSRPPDAAGHLIRVGSIGTEHLDLTWMWAWTLRLTGRLFALRCHVTRGGCYSNLDMCGRQTEAQLLETTHMLTGRLFMQVERCWANGVLPPLQRRAAVGWGRPRKPSRASWMGAGREG